MLNRILNIGIDSNTIHTDRKQIRVLNGTLLFAGTSLFAVGLFILLAMGPYEPIELPFINIKKLFSLDEQTNLIVMYDFKISMPIADIIFGLVIVSLLFLNYKRKFNTSVIILTMISMLFISMFYMVSKILGVFAFLLPSLIPLIFYKKKLFYYSVWLLNLIIFIFITIILHNTGTLTYIPEEGSLGILLINMIAVYAILFLLVNHVKEENVKNEKILVEQNSVLKSQAEEIITQRDTVMNQKDLIEGQNMAITNSILYAKRIQHALLPDISFFIKKVNDKKGIKDYFVFYKPKEIVSGDFYWANHIGKYIIVAVADCTGHGVPGGFMSMLGISFLNEIINNQEVFIACDILNKLRDNVETALKKADNKGIGDDLLEGISIVISVINTETMDLQYSGSYNPLILIRKRELSVFKTDRNTIGLTNRQKKSFTNHNIKLNEGDVIYMFSDGYIDQFNDDGSQRFKYSRFKDLLVKVSDMPLDKQKYILEENFNAWKGQNHQIDDVCILGLSF